MNMDKVRTLKSQVLCGLFQTEHDACYDACVHHIQMKILCECRVDMLRHV